MAAAFAVAAITFLLAGQGWAEADLRAMIAPLVTFLPGAMITMAVVELSAAEMITGASRLVAGSVQLLLLAAGIVGAAQVVGLPSADALIDTPANLLGWWASWLGVLLVGMGNYLYFSAPRRSLGWLCLVLYVAWIGQYLGDLAFGGYLSGFVGAIVMTPVAYLVEQRPSGPPALVSFLPAFWLLVPGALGLIGVTDYRQEPLWSREGLARLAEALRAWYPPDHECIVYEAAMLPVCEPKILRVPLSGLPTAPVTTASTLYVPPARLRR